MKQQITSEGVVLLEDYELEKALRFWAGGGKAQTKLANRIITQYLTARGIKVSKIKAMEGFSKVVADVHLDSGSVLNSLIQPKAFTRRYVGFYDSIRAIIDRE